MSSMVEEQFSSPPVRLQAVVRHLLLLQTPAKAPLVTRTLLPTFHPLLLLNLGPAAQVSVAPGPAHSLRDALLTGPLTTSLRYQLPGGARVLVVTFTLAGFYQLFQMPVTPLRGALVDPVPLLPAGRFAALQERLLLQGSLPQLGQTLAEFLGPCVQPPPNAQAELVACLPLLTQASPRSALKVLAAATQRSERTLQLRFQQYFGFSAKEATRFGRFRRLLAEVQPGPGTPVPPDWGTLLERHGYYDQPHLIHDFTYFAQQPPTKVAAQLYRGDGLCLPASDLF